MTEKELIEYRNRLLCVVPNLKTITLDRNYTYINTPNTSDRKAPDGISWINFWRAVSGLYDNEMTCSCCGNPIKAELSQTDDDKLQAHGAHVMKSIIDRDGKRRLLLFKNYITPLCSACNNHNKLDITLRQDSVLVQEIVERDA